MMKQNMEWHGPYSLKIGGALAPAAPTFCTSYHHYSHCPATQHVTSILLKRAWKGKEETGRETIQHSMVDYLAAYPISLSFTLFPYW